MRATIWLLVLLAAASCAEAATITVRRDGTGDYLTIQPALDAAAEGDTVSIGPGEYTEFIINPSTGMENYGMINVRDLTVIGAGADATIIGPAVYAPNLSAGTPWGIGCVDPQSTIAISDVTIRNCYGGLGLYGALEVSRCRFAGNVYACDFWSAAQDNIVRECLVIESPATTHTSMSFEGGGHYVVDNCEFVQTHPYVGNAHVEFVNCISRGPGPWGMIVAAGHAVLRNCRIYDVEGGIATSRAFGASHIDVYDSAITGSILAVKIGAETSATFQNTTLQGGSHSVIWADSPNELVVHGCDFVRGSGVVIRAGRFCSLGPVSYDLTKNYWGTTDEAQIQEWIVDVNDDPTTCATVQYSPFAGQSVPAEAKNWGGLKALWR
jgi:hypothetical protein